MAENGNGWAVWSKYVLEEIERLEKKVNELEDKMQKNCIDIAVLNVKSGIWGFLAGLLPALAVLVYWIVKR